MRYYVLVCAGHAETGEVIAARQTFEKLLLLLLTERFWPHGSDSGAVSDLQPGDRVLFCLATKSAPSIVGDALVASPSTALTAQQLAEIRIYLGPAMPPEPGILTHAVGLEHVVIWDEPWRPPGDDDPVAFDLAKALAGVYRTGSVRPLARETFGQILEQKRVTAPVPADGFSAAAATSPESGQPAISRPPRIQDLLRSWWDLIDLGEPMHLLDGSSIPDADAGDDPVDLVCEAGHSGDLVAVACVESGDPAKLIPAFKRRLAWLRENGARLGQRVRGLLLVLDPRIEVDLREEPDIEVWRLSLTLAPVRGETPQPVVQEEAPDTQAETVGAESPPPEPAPPADEPVTEEPPAEAPPQEPPPVRKVPATPPAPSPVGTGSAADFAQRCMNVPLSRGTSAPTPSGS